MHRIFPAVTGLLLCALAGCQSYAPYGPAYMNGGYTYGPTYAPTYSSPPIGGTYVQPQPGTVYTVPGRQAPLPAPLYTPRTAPPPGSSQPFQLPAGQPASGMLPPAAGAPRTVPQPIEPGPARIEGEEAIPPIKLPPGGTGSPNSLGADPLGEEEFSKPDKQPLGARSSDEIKSTLLPGDASPTIRQKIGGPANFKTGTTLPGAKGAADTTGASFESSTSDPQRLNPHGFDRKAYTWLRGTLDYDQIDRKWHITYSTLNSDPSERDSNYGGSLTLSPDNRLEEYLASDVVLVEGSIDTNQRDRFGKPMYRLNKIVRLQDPSTVSAETAETK